MHPLGTHYQFGRQKKNLKVLDIQVLHRSLKSQIAKCLNRWANDVVKKLILKKMAKANKRSKGHIAHFNVV